MVSTLHVVSILPADYYGPKPNNPGVPVTSLNASRTTSAIRILPRFLVREKLAPWRWWGSTIRARRWRGPAAPWRGFRRHLLHRYRKQRGVHRRLALAWTASLATVTTAVSHRAAQTSLDMGIRPVGCKK